MVTKSVQRSSRHGLVLCRNKVFGLNRVYMKAVSGRERKLPNWKQALFRDWRSEFDRLHKVGVKCNYRNRNLGSLCRYILQQSETDERQLSPKLQCIISNRRNQFEGDPVYPTHGESVIFSSA